MKTGTLYIVATPIGNLEDITLRAIRVLKEVSLIAAEDTRQTRKLLNHYGITTRVTSYHEHNEKEKAERLMETLRGGDSVALVSDAGTPGISDPGYRLTSAAVEGGVEVVAVPGPSAFVSVLCVSGFAIDRFTFMGFLPHGKAAKRKFILEMLVPDHTFVAYESPRRIKETLGEIKELLGDVEVVVGREMTKLHEEVFRGRVARVIEDIGERDLKGEVTLVVRTGRPAAGVSYYGELKRLLDEGFHIKDAVKAVAAEFGLPRSDVYREALKIKGTLTGNDANLDTEER